MRKNLLALSILLLVACDYQAQTPVPSLNKERTKTKATNALTFCKEHKYNTQFCILVDMSLHSGLNRMIVWDFAKDTIEYACPVSHGCCGNPWGFTLSKNAAQFSNKDGSHCSALGKYKIGSRGYSNWGIHVNYLMHGLEKNQQCCTGETNSVALVGRSKRYLMLSTGYTRGMGLPCCI